MPVMIMVVDNVVDHVVTVDDMIEIIALIKNIMLAITSNPGEWSKEVRRGGTGDGCSLM